MSKKLLSFIIFLLVSSTYSFAQSNKNTAIVKGKLVNSITKAPFNDLKVTIPDVNVFSTSDGDGAFEISEVPLGTHILVITSFNAKRDTVKVVVDKNIIDLGEISIVPNENGAAPESIEIPTIALEENNTSTDDDGISTQNASNLVIANKDPFVATAAYIFGYYRFQPRGYSRSSQELQVNGAPINDVETGNATWNTMGGLNDVFHGRNVQYGLTPSSYTFGGINGSAYISATAADQREETRVSYTITDRNYNNRIMLTHNSGLSKKGWAYSVSASKRWAEKGYIPGTAYDGYSYYASVSKVIKKGQLNLTTFASPTTRAKAAAATEEAYSLAGTNYYNHDWGYMPDGTIRNAVVQRTFQPITILNYEYKPNDKFRWNTAVAYEFGKDKTSGLTGYNYDPSVIGDYYKNMPSYYQTLVPPDTNTANTVRKQLMSNPNQLQLNWNRMYQDNYLNTQTMYNVNGISGNNYTGKQSIYVISDRVNSLKKFSLNSSAEYALDEHTTLYGGVTFISQSTESYQQMNDLLGGDYFVNYNTFAAQQYVGSPTYNQNNLNDPNQIIRVGDKYGYDYTIRFTNAFAWGQAVYTYNKFDFFVALSGGDNSFSRDGFMRNGLFPNNSYGKSATQSFFDYAVKGGIDYKIDARNFLFVNAAYTTTPPTADNTYISAQTRDFIVNNPSVQKNESLEAGYSLKSSKVNARVTGYVTDIKNATEIKRFYNDDPAYNTFVNYVMQGENTRSIGTELSLEYKLTRELSFLGVASIGQAFYTNNPNISVYLDNDTTQHATSAKSYIKNYYLSTGPQTAYTAGFNYRPKRDMYITINFNYFDNNYVEVNPNRRTTEAAGLYPVGSPMWHEIFDQEKLPSAFTVDLRAGKTIQLSRMSKTVNKIARNSTLAITGGVSNLLNNTNVINTGFEQLRYDFTDSNPAKFANKYIYGMGINFFVNATLKF